MGEWLALGDRAVRLPRPSGPSPDALVHAIRRWPGVVDVVVTREHVAAYFDGEPRLDRAAIERLGDLDAGAVVSPARIIEIAAIYDGPDLADLARRVGLTESEVATVHAATTYEVDTMGFAPGFAYLTGLDSRLHVPRRATPRARVPAGSIAIAAGHTAVYPFDSPGGWHLIGRVAGLRMFGDRGSLLHLGDRVRFVR